MDPRDSGQWIAESGRIRKKTAICQHNILYIVAVASGRIEIDVSSGYVDENSGSRCILVC